MKTKKLNKYDVAIIVSIVAVVAFCVISVLFDVVSAGDLPANYIGATLGSLIGAIITLVLLRGQTDIEEKKGKDIQILKKKIKVFRKYIKDVWRVWEDQKITIEEFQNLTSMYYQNLMTYLEKDRLTEVGNKLSALGKCVGNDSFDNYKILRENIFSIINILSADIGLGGQIDPDIMDEHDTIVFPLLFKNMILDELNRKLVYANSDSALKPGKYDHFREGPYNAEFVCFNFKKYDGCKILIGPFTGQDLHFALIVDRKYSGVNDFRTKKPAQYWQRIEKAEVVLSHPVNKDDTEKAPPLNFSDENSMEIYRTEKRNFANILAGRVEHCFTETKIVDDLPITDFLEKYVGGEN